jgi:hypothetical protein
MQGNCHKADEVDLAAVLTEPQNPEWEAFRQHYPQCEVCSTKVYQWTNLENILRTMGKEIPATHPSEERLAQFQQNPGILAPEEQHAIQQHLQACPACKEELSFDFSPMQQWLDEEKPAQARTAKRPTLGEALVDQIARLLEAVRSLVLHPAFAYGIVLLLLLPRFLTQSLGPVSGPIDRSQPLSIEAGQERGVGSGPTRTVAPSHLSPDEAALMFLDKYKTAYEARDIRALDRLWKANDDWRSTVAQLFEESRHLSLLFDIRDVRVGDTKNEASVEFAQVTTVLNKEGRFYTKGPISYIAELRRREGSSGWEVQDLQRVPD